MSGALLAAMTVDPYGLVGINWADIPTGGSHSNANQTCNAPSQVVLKFTHALGNGVLEYSLNGSPPTSFANNNTTLAWSPGDTLHFVAVAAASGGVVTVLNTSDGNVVVDTFTVTYP